MALISGTDLTVFLTRSESMCVKNNVIIIIIESHLEFGAKPVCNSNFYD